MTVGDPLLAWREGERPAPVSRRFDDLYFSAEDGLAESRAVFLAGNGLPERFLGRRFFAIGETGFGTGLNFLASWQAWSEGAAPDARLLYLSVEGFPLARADLARALAGWPELAGRAEALVAAYPKRPRPGLHRLHLDGGRVTVMLLIAEAAALAQIEGRMDAWYLDGFAPARNPQIWRPAVLAAVAGLSGPETTLASFTAAGAVRRDLAAAGFAVERRPGFRGKRHRIIGRFVGPAPGVPGDRDAAMSERESEPAALCRNSPWYRRVAPAGSVRTAAVIGAGIAGASVAHALARRGVQVTVFEAASAAAMGASGNPVGIVMPDPAAGPSPAGAFSCAAFAETRATIEGLTRRAEETRSAALDIAQDWSGVLDFSRPDPAARAPRLLAQDGQGAVALAALTAEAASDAAGVRLDRPAIRFAEAGRIDPAALCRALLAGCDLRCGTPVAGLRPADAGWRLLAADGTRLATADIVVLAGGPGLAALAQSALVQSALVQSALVPGDQVLGDLVHGERGTGQPAGASGQPALERMGSGPAVPAQVVPAQADPAQAPELPAALPLAAWLPLRYRRGQITLVPAEGPARGLRQVLVGGGYALPAGDGRLCLGATYTAPDMAPGATPDEGGGQRVRARDHDANRAAIAEAFPGLGVTADTPVLGGRAALRAATPDRQLLAGPLPDPARFLAAFAGLRHGGLSGHDPGAGEVCLPGAGEACVPGDVLGGAPGEAPSPFLPGLYVLGGLGSRGLTTALLAADLIATEALAEPSPLLRTQREMLHPARALVRGLRRGEV